ncbi:MULTISPECIES: SLC13 family permease [Maribacter]|uniref:SLC13 family permease n=1 Tax=Maribacter flavus TaxID=1658664 RepID=A0ABU7IEC7_9FLAO|nr:MULTISPECIES: SLC13 family permease [Maribacter]MDC6404160.1 SLC13 family permease [Maribacter sp. PR66]MEE1971303.1 SLC13 family permease [Maribacter flavus]
MTWEIITVFVIIGALIILFALEVFPMDKISFFIIGALLLSGLVSPEEAVSGFSNKAVITILCLMILAIGLEENAVISWFAKGLKVLKNWPALLVLIVIMILSGGVSAFISSTAVVIVFIKIVAELKDKYGLMPGKLLLPISFASILGGSCTLMGTSTNLIVNNIFMRYTGETLGFFEFSKIGLIFLGTSIGIIVLFYSFLPEGEKDGLSQKFNLNKYLLTLKVDTDSPLIGTPLKESFMYKEPEITVLRVSRNNYEMNLSNPKFEIQQGDVILLHCSLENLQKMRGEGYFDLEVDENLTSSFSKGTSIEKVDDQKQDPEEKVSNTVLLELLLLPGSRFLGNTLESLKKMIFPRAIPIAVNKRKSLTNLKNKLHLSNKTITKLKVGDRLLIQTDASYIQNFENSNNLAVLNQFDGGIPSTPLKRNLSLFILIITIILAATGAFEIMTSVIAGTIAMLLFKCIELNKIYEKINWQIIFLLAGMIPLGIAMTNSGADAWLTEGLLGLMEGQRPMIIIGMLFLTTMLLSGVVSNNATAIIMAPIAISLAKGLELDVKPFILCVMFAANFSFFTPLGYQTNALIYSMGIYKFKHFLILGGIISLVLLVLGTLLLSAML